MENKMNTIKKIIAEQPSLSACARTFEKYEAIIPTFLSIVCSDVEDEATLSFVIRSFHCSMEKAEKGYFFDHDVKRMAEEKDDRDFFKHMLSKYYSPMHILKQLAESLLEKAGLSKKDASELAFRLRKFDYSVLEQMFRAELNNEEAKAFVEKVLA